MKRVAWCLAIRRTALAMALILTGCTTGWRTPSLAPEQVVREQGPTELQVRAVDGSVFYLRDPAVRGDSIVGWTPPAWDADGPLRLRAVAVRDVKQVGVRGPDTVANIFLGVLIGLGTWFILIGAAGGFAAE